MKKYSFIKALLLPVVVLLCATGCETEYKHVSGDTELDVEFDNNITSDEFRLICFNIQNGMWWDQANNYDNFVAWVQKYNPDIMCIQEASTIYKNGTKSSQSYAKRYLPYGYQDYTPSSTLDMEPKGWKELAKRWGHDYVVIGAHQDNFPVVFTSRFPIQRIAQLGGPLLSHGGCHVIINGIHMVGLHTWPQAYAKGDSDTNPSNRTRGNQYRLQEVQDILSRTINSDEYYDEKNWIIMGDFNSKFNEPAILEMQNNSLTDILTYNHNYVSRTGRVDYIFATDNMLRSVVQSVDIQDGFARSEQHEATGFWKYSDHYPLMVDFKIYDEEE